MTGMVEETKWDAREDRPTLVGLVLCGIVAAYFLLVAAYALLHYSEFAAALPQFLRYVLVPAAIGGIFVFIGLFRARWSRTAGIYGLSVLAALFLFEGYLMSRQIPTWLGMLGRMNAEQRAALAANDGVMRGFTLLRLNRLADSRTLRTSILSGLPSTRVILCTRNGEVVSYWSDRYGFNNPDDAYRGTPDLVLLGDSFMEGFCLPPGEDVAAQLRARGVASTSLGIRGNGPLVELASLGRFGPVLAPRNVVLAFFEGNDWENLERELTEPWLRAALVPGADFGTQSAAAEAMVRAKAAMREADARAVTMADLLRKRATLRNFFALQQTGTALGLTYPKIPHAIPEFRTVLARAKSIAAQWNGHVSILYVPRVDRFLGAIPADGVFDQIRTLVLDAAEQEKVPVIDLAEILRRERDPAAMYAPDGHFSQEGAAFVASVLARSANGHPGTFHVSGRAGAAGR